MAKKIWYSQPLAAIWESYNKTFKKQKLSPKEFIWEWLTPQILNPFMPDGTPTQTNILIGDLFYADTIKKLLHLYFVDKSLRDFLINLPIADFSGLKKFIIENGEEIQDGCLTTLGQQFELKKKTRTLDFGIHIPFENKYKGYAFSFLYKPEENTLIFVWLVEKDAGYISFDEYNKLERDNSEKSKKISSYLRLAVNTIAYMNAFPECIVDGVPNNIKEEYSKSIKLSEKVVENLSDTKRMTPHFRRGYFKCLTSDFYTKKKGQIVFVKETMVNGNAKTVYTADNLEEIKIT